MNDFLARGMNASAALFAGVVAAACAGGDTAGASAASTIGGGTAASDATTTTSSAGAGRAAPTEKVLDVKLALSGTTLTITALDGVTPVMTDAWLYTLENGALAPLTGFHDPGSRRRYRGLMMPCTLAGAPSGLAPCDDGALNGVMTDRIRERYVNGKKQSAIHGTVTVTLDAAPASPVVVVVAREDQRYCGAAAIDPSGQPVATPPGVGAPETHAPVTYAHDVKPIFDARCVGCHSRGGPAEEKPLDTYDAIVDNDFGHAEAVAQCEEQFAGDAAGLQACEDSITHVEYMMERGAPANSGFLRRTLPDRDKGASAVGLLWFGSANGSRFGGHGDRRMPPTNITADTSDDDPRKPTYFDDHPGDYQLLWSWVAQGAPQ